VPQLRSTVAAHEPLRVLALNSGSSSLKFGVYQVDHETAVCLISGEAEALGCTSSAFHAFDAQGLTIAQETLPIPSHREAMQRISALPSLSTTATPQAIGHRIVHGGPTLRAHCRIDAAVEQTLKAACAFAPLHTPAALSVIGFAQTHFPELPQVACFDTSFHARMPPVAHTLALPATLRAQGIQRYGFHGLSCESIVAQLAGDLPGRLVIAHLGNGASITAVRNGISIDTTMGLTPTGGLIMGTRTGDLDPGILVYLAREKRFGAEMLEDLVDRCGGLLGISGVASDMRSLHAAAPLNADASLAIDMFCYAARKQLAGMVAALHGVDLLVFTGGIGEHDSRVRAEVCCGLSWLGIELDETFNMCNAPLISTSASRCRVQVLPSLEDAQIASQTRASIH